MKVAIYTRVSKTDGSQNVERQKTQLREYAHSQNWQIIEEIEENISGKKVRRSGTLKLVNLARANKIQKVLIHEISRLGRNVTDVYNTVEELSQNKVSIYDYNSRQDTLDKNFQTTTFANLILPILAGMAAEWLQQHSYRIKSGLKLARKNGKQLGCPKKDTLKQEKEVIRLYEQKFIEDEFGRKSKVSYRKLAKYLEISPDTVRRILRKNDINLKLIN